VRLGCKYVPLNSNALRRSRFHLSKTTQRVSDLRTAIADMERTLGALSNFIGAEEVRTRISDIKHVAYSTAAIAAMQRSARIRASIANLKLQYDVAVRERDRARGTLFTLRAAE